MFLGDIALDDSDVESLFGETVDDFIDHAKKTKSKEEFRKSFVVQQPSPSNNSSSDLVNDQVT